jgi:ribonuclease HIII
VACASILARAEFLTRLHSLSREIGAELPKGASAQVEEAAVKLVRARGAAILDKVAKTHFKTTARVLGLAGVAKLV